MRSVTKTRNIFQCDRSCENETHFLGTPPFWPPLWLCYAVGTYSGKEIRQIWQPRSGWCVQNVCGICELWISWPCTVSSVAVECMAHSEFWSCRILQKPTDGEAQTSWVCSYRLENECLTLDDSIFFSPALKLGWKPAISRWRPSIRYFGFCLDARARPQKERGRTCCLVSWIFAITCTECAVLIPRQLYMSLARPGLRGGLRHRTSQNCVFVYPNSALVVLCAHIFMELARSSDIKLYNFHIRLERCALYPLNFS